MKLSLRQKQLFYHGLAQLLRSGINIERSLETLSTGATGSYRAFLSSIRSSISGGATIGDAFSKQQPAVSAMEVAIVESSIRSGRGEQGCQYLSHYFERLSEMRRQIIQKSLYPIFLLHFAILAISVPLLFSGDTEKFVSQGIGTLIASYLIAAILAAFATMLSNLAQSSATIDTLLMRVPVLGKMRRCSALSRFCATFDMQLAAGVNVVDAIATSARATQSGRIRSAVRGMLNPLRQGSQIGPLLSKSPAFPAEMSNAISIAEETGQLDAELARLTQDYDRRTVQAIDALAEWLPKILYIAIMIYVGWQIICAAQGMQQGYMRALDEL